MTDPNPSPPRLIARQIALAFGVISVVAVAMCALLITVLHDVSGLVEGMQHDEASIRQGRELATAVRGLSIHLVHALVEPDAAHVERYQGERDRVRRRIQELAPHVPAAEQWRLQALGERTQQMHALLEAALPNARRKDVDAVRTALTEIEGVSQKAADHADALARATASQMVHAHVLATHSTRFGIVGGLLCVVLVLVLSIAFTWRIRRAVLKPLLTLSEAARRLGGGDFQLRVGTVGRGELAAVGQAFDSMADELGRREQRLVQSERMAAIGQLAAGVAHELNNPIGIIRGYLKTMSPDGDPQTLREELLILDEEAKACQTIAADLLAYARSDQLSLSQVQMQTFLNESVKRFAESPSGSAHQVQMETQEGLLIGDEARLRQVMLNLMSNAAQVSPSEHPIMVRGALDGAHYVVEVEDRGPGVRPDDRLRIFEPFYTQRRGGTGLGLSVCSSIVAAHQGSIEVVDGSADGALFRLRLPLQRINS